MITSTSKCSIAAIFNLPIAATQTSSTPRTRTSRSITLPPTFLSCISESIYCHKKMSCYFIYHITLFLMFILYKISIIPKYYLHHYQERGDYLMTLLYLNDLDQWKINNFNFIVIQKTYTKKEQTHGNKLLSSLPFVFWMKEYNL